MKRLLLSSLIISFLATGAHAARIASADAISVAGEFLASRGLKTSAIYPASANTRTGGSHTPYYLFNIGESDGFIIVADYDSHSSVIAYSLEGSISPESMPEACKAWLDALATTLVDRKEAKTPKGLAYPGFIVEPLLKNHWDQNDPYNRLCPIDNTTGLRSTTGCVATAAAQVMGYYQYPSQPTGKIEYEDRLQDEIRTFDFSAMAPIDWNNISDTYTLASSEKECDAIAGLMNAMAHGARMQFSSDTSIAYNYSAAQALIEFFGYSPDMHYYERALLSDQEWIDIIASELAAARPVLYEGKNPSMGHAFVCDGYDGQGFFHINWGWSGLSDGYFSLSALTPPTQSTGGSDSGYALSQTIICNIAPAGTSGLLPQEKGLLNIDKLYFRDSTEFHYAGDGADITSPLAGAQLFFYSFNKGLRPFTGEVCAAVLDLEDFTPLTTVAVDGLRSQNYTSIRFPLADATLPEGSHRIGFFYRTSSDSVWYPVGCSTPGAPSQCIVTISGDRVSMSPVFPDIMPQPVTDIDYTRLYSNSTATMSFELANEGSVRLEAHAGVAILDAGGRYLSLNTVPAACPARDKVTVAIEIPLQGIQPGEYQLMPFYSYSRQPSKADIHPLATEPFYAVVEGVMLTPATGSYFSANPTSPLLELNATNLTSFAWSAPVMAEIYAQNGSYIASLPAIEMTLSPLATSSFIFDCSHLKLPRGAYSMRFLTDDAKPILLAELPLMVTADMTSASEIEADGIEIDFTADITVTSPELLSSVTLFDASGRIIAYLRNPGNNAVIPASHLPRGIYLIRITTQSGNTTTRKLRF